MYLQKSSNPELVHGVDYHKGLEDGHECLRKHEFNTVGCRPVLFMKKEEWVKEEDWVDYDSLSDREKLELGEPVFFGSSLHRKINGERERYRETTAVQNFNTQGEEIENS